MCFSVVPLTWQTERERERTRDLLTGIMSNNQAAMEAAVQEVAAHQLLNIAQKV